MTLRAFGRFLGIAGLLVMGAGLAAMASGDSSPLRAAMAPREEVVVLRSPPMEPVTTTTVAVPAPAASAVIGALPVVLEPTPTQVTVEAPAPVTTTTRPCVVYALGRCVVVALAP